MRPTSIKRIDTETLRITWDTGHESVFTLRHLRDICPCAACQGETVLLRSYVPAPADRSVPGRYELAGIQPVGSYAVQISWADGHGTGIYTWEHLIEHCPCEEHGGKKTS